MPLNLLDSFGLLLARLREEHRPATVAERCSFRLFTPSKKAFTLPYSVLGIVSTVTNIAYDDLHFNSKTMPI